MTKVRVQKEILYGVAQDDADNIKYALDQLSSASIEISADSTDVVDKKGNVIRTTYRTKTGGHFVPAA